jgi:hypothetical protein
MNGPTTQGLGNVTLDNPNLGYMFEATGDSYGQTHFNQESFSQ